MSKHSDRVNVEVGTVTFWIRKNKLNWNDGLIRVLMNLSNYSNARAKGSILILKDSDNKLKFFHVILGKGRTDVETDVSILSVSEDHFFAFTWSIETGEIIMYIDGEKAKRSEIKYFLTCVREDVPDDKVNGFILQSEKTHPKLKYEARPAKSGKPDHKDMWSYLRPGEEP